MSDQDLQTVEQQEPKAVAKRPTFLNPDDERAAQLAEVMVRSGFFKEAKQGAQAMVKILAGRELGLLEVRSMMGFEIIEGRIEMKPALMAALVKQHPKYDYRVVQSSRQVCEIEFRQREDIGQPWETLGVATFTIDDAIAAGLCTLKDGKPFARSKFGSPLPWETYTDQMLFARCMSKGVRQHCPEVTLGMPIYTEGEVTGETEFDVANAIDVDAVPHDVEQPVLRDTAGAPAGVDTATGEVIDIAEAPVEQADSIGAEGQTVDSVPGPSGGDTPGPSADEPPAPADSAGASTVSAGYATLMVDPEKGHAVNRTGMVHASKPQIAKLGAITTELGWSDEERRARAGCSYKDLSKDGAKFLIDQYDPLVSLWRANRCSRLRSACQMQGIDLDTLLMGAKITSLDATPAHKVQALIAQIEQGRDAVPTAGTPAPAASDEGGSEEVPPSPTDDSPSPRDRLDEAIEAKWPGRKVIKMRFLDKMQREQKIAIESLTEAQLQRVLSILVNEGD